MNNKAYLIPFIAVFAVMFVGLVSAQLANNSTVFNPTLQGIVTTFNDVALVEGQTTPIAGITGETAPVRVIFKAQSSASDVRVKVWMEGFRNDVSASTSRLTLVSGSTYSELLNLQLPSDINDLTKEFTLHVSISNSDQYEEKSYTVVMQRDSYSLDVLSVDYPLSVSAGDTVPVTIVVKNNGMETLQDGYVIAAIPSLGIASRGYFGDLVPVENCTDNCNQDDSVQKTVYLKLPENTAAGVYELQLQVYNQDTKTTISKMISVGQSASTSVIPAVVSQDIKAGETKTYNLLVVNSGDRIRVFNVQTVSGNGLTVSAPTVITVGPQASTTIPVTVTADKSATIGSNSFTVSVDGQQTVFSANVVPGSIVSSTNSVVALTVVLVIIFVVLLVVLIVLLTRKEKTSEEVETSYY